MVYAERWGWTPQQVDDLPLETSDWLLPIAELFDKEQEYRMEKQKREAERKSKRKGN